MQNEEWIAVAHLTGERLQLNSGNLDQLYCFKSVSRLFGNDFGLFKVDKRGEVVLSSSVFLHLHFPDVFRSNSALLYVEDCQHQLLTDQVEQDVIVEVCEVLERHFFTERESAEVFGRVREQACGWVSA